MSQQTELNSHYEETVKITFITLLFPYRPQWYANHAHSIGLTGKFEIHQMNDEFTLLSPKQSKIKLF